MDTVPGRLGGYVRGMVHKRAAGPIPKALATYAFCNGMTPQQRRFTQARWYPEASSIAVENVDRSGMPGDVPRTSILTLRHRALPPKKLSAETIAELGG